MGCCGKSKRTKVKRLLEEPDFLKNSLKLLKSFKDTNPMELKNKTLLDYHRKTHMIYADNIKRRPTKKTFINAIVKLHNKFVKEMEKRNVKHTSPLNKI